MGSDRRTRASGTGGVGDVEDRHRLLGEEADVGGEGQIVDGGDVDGNSAQLARQRRRHARLRRVADVDDSEARRGIGNQRVAFDEGKRAGVARSRPAARDRMSRIGQIEHFDAERAFGDHGDGAGDVDRHRPGQTRRRRRAEHAGSGAIRQLHHEERPSAGAGVRDDDRARVAHGHAARDAVERERGETPRRVRCRDVDRLETRGAGRDQRD